MTPEGRVKNKVNKALHELGAYRFMPVQRGMGAPALDYYNCLWGMFVAVETKVPGKQLTDRQKNTACQIAGAGGIVFVIRDQTDIDIMIERLKWRKDNPNRYGDIVDKLWSRNNYVYSDQSADDPMVNYIPDFDKDAQ